jgi:transcriptional regulator with XRE-family HTH domain
MSPRPRARDREPTSPRLAYEEELLRGEAVEVIADLLADHGISRKRLAERLGVGEARVSRILSGRENATLATIAELGDALGVRFALVPIPYEDREGTPAADDPPPPEWLDRRRLRIADTERAAGVPPRPGRGELEGAANSTR